jgi:hypothetical protein
MTASDAQSHPRVIVVGERQDSLVREVVRLAGGCELATTQCEDIYSAATELARYPDGGLMVIGTFRQLTRGKGDFLALAQRNGAHCCCLLDRGAGVERVKLLAVVRLGVRLAGEMADVRNFFDERLAAERGRDAEAREDLFSGEFRATADELKALLGQETDG